MAVRQCPFCGRLVTADWSQCPYCREALPPVPLVAPSQPRERAKYREGLLCALLAAIIHYFAGGYSLMSLPFPIQPIVTTYLSPLLLLSGLGLILYSFAQRHRSSN